MAGDVELDLEVLNNRLDRLLSLHDNVTTLAGALQDMSFRQTRDIWSEARPAQNFMSVYRNRIEDYKVSLDAVRTLMGEYKDALVASATALQLQDEAVQERLRLLTERLAQPSTQAPMCTPDNPTGTSIRPPGPMPSPAPTPSPSPSPVPTATPTPTSTPTPTPAPSAAPGGSSW